MMVHHRTSERSGRVVESSRFRHLTIIICIIQNEITTLNLTFRTLSINLPQPLLTWSLELSSSTIESGSGSIEPSIHSAIWIHNTFNIYPSTFVFQETITFETARWKIIPRSNQAIAHLIHTLSSLYPIWAAMSSLPLFRVPSRVASADSSPCKETKLQKSNFIYVSPITQRLIILHRTMSSPQWLQKNNYFHIPSNPSIVTSTVLECSLDLPPRFVEDKSVTEVSVSEDEKDSRSWTR